MTLRVITLSDISTPEGHHITSAAFGAIHGNGLRDLYEWPRPSPISPSFRSLWQRALTRTFLSPYDSSSARELRGLHRLGFWELPTVLSSWKWRCSPDNQRLFLRRDTSWEVWTNCPLVRRRFIPSGITVPSPPPQATHLCTLHHRGHFCTLENSFPWHLAPPDTDPLTHDPFSESYPSLEFFLDALSSASRVLLHQFNLPEDQGEAIAQALRLGTAAAVCDGSYDPSLLRGTSAFVLAASSSASPDSFLHGANHVPGSPQDQSSYRSELAGISGTLSVLQAITQHHGITSGGVTIALDGFSAMTQAKGHWPLKLAQPSFDMLLNIRAQIRALPITVSWHCVQGHQREKGVRYLDWWARQNDLVDAAAKSFMRRTYRGPNPLPLRPVRLLHEPWSLGFDHSKLATISIEDLAARLVRFPVTEYWRTHHDHPIADPSSVDWPPSSKAIARLPIGLQRWRWKFATGCIGVASQLKCRQCQASSACPLCGADHEKVSHVLHCPDPEAQAYALSRFSTISTALQDTKTAPLLHDAILRSLTLWRKGNPILPLSFPPAIRPIIRAQHAIGWNNFVLGRWSPLWREAQSRHYLRTRSQRSGLRWAAHIIHKLFLFSWDIWSYRNTRLHGDNGVRHTAAMASADALVQDACALGPTSVGPSSRPLFTAHTLEELLALPLTDKQRWLAQVRSAQTAFACTSQRPLTLSREALLLRSWLTSQ